MKNFEALQEICLKEVRHAGIVPGNIVKWSVNRRAKSRWGLCIKKINGECEIQISARLLEDDRISEQACKETILHEILHSCKECSGHTGRWKEYAERMNKIYGYHIKRVTTGEEKGVENYEMQRQPVKYIFRCTNCGQLVTRKRECEFTRHFRKYICGICGKKAFRPINKTGKHFVNGQVPS